MPPIDDELSDFVFEIERQDLHGAPSIVSNAQNDDRESTVISNPTDGTDRANAAPDPRDILFHD